MLMEAVDLEYLELAAALVNRLDVQVHREQLQRAKYN